MPFDNTKYEAILLMIKEMSHPMFDIICKEMDMPKYKGKTYKYYFALCQELFKALDMCADGIYLQSYSQICTLFRQMLEQVAIISIIDKNNVAREFHAKFANAKFEYIRDPQNTEELDDLFDNSQVIQKKIEKAIANGDTPPQKNNYNCAFYDLGWLESVGVKNFNYDQLFKKAKLEYFAKLRKYYNNFVHYNVFAIQYATTQDGIIFFQQGIIANMGMIMSALAESYSYITGFNFNFSFDINFGGEIKQRVYFNREIFEQNLKLIKQDFESSHKQ